MTSMIAVRGDSDACGTPLSYSAMLEKTALCYNLASRLALSRARPVGRGAIFRYAAGPLNAHTGDVAMAQYVAVVILSEAQDRRVSPHGAEGRRSYASGAR
jgi:hypothetical protein